MEKERNKLYNFLVWSCFIFYNATLISKNIFTAQIVNITDYLGIEKATAQLCSTYYFFPYAIGQLLIAPFMKKIDVKKALVIMITLSSIVVCSMAFANDIVFFYVAHALNGALQILTWAGIMSICSKYLPNKFLTKSNKLLTFGFASGVGLSYAISALFSVISLWKGTFVCGGLILFVSTVAFIIAVKKVDNLPKEETEISVNGESVKLAKEVKAYSVNGRTVLFYIISIICSFIVYSTYYAIMPNVTFFFTEVFNMDPSLSIFISVCFPLCISIGGVYVVALCEKFKRYLIFSSVLSLIATVFTLVLVFTFDIHYLLSLILLVLVLVISRGSSTIVGIVLVVDIRDEIDAGRFSAITNAAGSTVAAIMPPLMATFIPNGNPNWQLFFIVCVILGVVTSGFTVIYDFMFYAKKRKKEN